MPLVENPRTVENAETNGRRDESNSEQAEEKLTADER
jgi:hypothetical protein